MTPSNENTPFEEESVSDLSSDDASVPEAAPAAEAPEKQKKTPLYRRQLAFGSRKGGEKGGEEPPAAETPLAAAEHAQNGHAVKAQRARGGRGGKSRKVVGLKIGASQLAAAVVSNRDDRHELHQLARMPLEQGIIVDGEVRDAPALTRALRTFFAENDLPTKDVRLGLASNRIGVRTFDIVGVDDAARLDNAVRFKAHEVLPVAVHESVLDYRVLSAKRVDGESVQRVLLVVAPRDQVQPYANVCRDAGLRIEGADLEALGLLRTFLDPISGHVPAGDDRATVVISIGHESSTLLVAGAGIAEFARVFDWGGAQLVDALAQELEIGSEEAAATLRRLSLAPGPPQSIEGLDDDARMRAHEAVRLRLTPFARELVASLQFYQTQPDSLGIGEIVITGGTSQLTGLDDALNRIIGVPVRVGDPLARVVIDWRLDEDHEAALGSLAVPIGLAIEDGAVRSVDLLKGDKPSTKRVPAGSIARIALPVAAVVPVVAVGFMFVQAQGDVSDKQETLAAKEAQLAKLPQPTRPQLGAGVGTEQQGRATALSKVIGGRLAWDGLLRDVAKILPSDVWLTELRASAPVSAAAESVPAAPSATGAPTGVTLTGYTYRQDDVAELLARLSALPKLDQVQLGGTTKQEIAEKPVVQFTILANLREAGGS
jgi:type IV pilus assembly protein PilM